MGLVPRRAIVALSLALAAGLPAAAVHAQEPARPADRPQATPVPPVIAPEGGRDAAGLSADLFYRIVLGEVALQRGELPLAARAFYEAARESRSPQLARRATEVALTARQRQLAEASARLWSELEPIADRPRQILAAIASGNTARLAEDAGDNELRTRLERFLAEAATTGAGVGEPFLQLNRVFAQQTDKVAVFRLISELAAPYKSSAEAQFAIGLAGLNTGLTDAAIATASLAAADEALKLKPDWDRGVLLKSEIIAKRSAADALAYLDTEIAKQPQSRALLSAQAQLLTEQKRYADARAVYRKLLAADPDQPEIRFGVAVLSVQMKDWDAAESELQGLKKAGFGDAGQVEFYLAQVAEERGRFDEAIARYKDVPEGERGWISKLRVGIVMGKQGKRAEARRWLADLPAVTIEQRVQVRQTEAQVYRDVNDNATALTILDQALVEHPESSDLMYDRSMVLEKLDRIADAEAMLRKLVEMKPEDPQALNALGYTLVDRTSRAQEGFELIEKAHKLAPTDPFILDSMGWALYRLGRLDEAEQYLVRAFTERPDPEIAAHLGEVLFAKGQASKAREIWQSQLKLTPDHPLLLETMRRHSR